MDLLEAQREQQRSAGGFECQEAASASPVDDAAAQVRRHPAYVRPMPRDEPAHRLIAALRLQRGGIRQVGESSVKMREVPTGSVIPSTLLRIELLS